MMQIKRHLQIRVCDQWFGWGVSGNIHFLLCCNYDQIVVIVIIISICSTFDAGHPDKTKQVVRIVSQEVRQHYPGPYSRYTDFPKKTKDVIHAEFLVSTIFGNKTSNNYLLFFKLTNILNF